MILRKLYTRGRMQTLEDQREFWLTLDALVVGLGYAFGPEAWQSSGTFYYFNKLFPIGGMDTVGWICLGLAFLLLINRFVLHLRNATRIAHAFGFMIFTAQVVLILLAMIFGQAQSGAGSVHLAVVAWLHWTAAREQPVLRWRHRRETPTQDA